MRGKLFPGPVSGVVSAPSSKSFMQRFVACAVLSATETVIKNAAFSGDSRVALNFATALGAAVKIHGKTVVICPGSHRISPLLNAGESGLALRMFTPIAAQQPFSVTITAEGTLRYRPVGMMESPLRRLGVFVESKGGFPPIRIHGPLHGGKLSLDGGITSQFLTGLLMVLPICGEGSELKVSNLKSRPYVEMTLSVLRSFGICWDVTDGDEMVFRCEGRQKFCCPSLAVPGDWSGAAALLAAGAVSGSVTVTGLPMDNLQADRLILDILEEVGATVSVSNGSITVTQKELNGFSVDVTHCPDLVPVLVAISVHCRGRSRITGTSRLRFKESDRARTLQREYAKLGAEIEVAADEIRIRGGGLRGGSVSASGDHRIAMSLAIAALSAESPVEIEGVECVDKSYPDFFDEISKLGVRTEFTADR